MDFIRENLGMIGIVIGVVIIVLIVISGYCKAPPEEAYIIAGLRRRGGELMYRKTRENGTAEPVHSGNIKLFVMRHTRAVCC